MCRITVKESLSGVLSELSPNNNGAIRLLAIYSAAIALDDVDLLKLVTAEAMRFGVKREHLYEIVLQSYLFLGFPRMLNAVEALDQQLPAENLETNIGPVSSSESQDWWKKGTDLCKQIYGDKYEPLKQKVTAMAPEVFRWMLIEGYGKVLSRGLLPIREREISIIAFLAVENRPKQLRSHILGAINVGASPNIISQVMMDLRPVAPEGTDQADRILERIMTN